MVEKYHSDHESAQANHRHNNSERGWLIRLAGTFSKKN